jgi:uncharacterized protein with von Willebrand factor type A (vWA) domain
VPASTDVSPSCFNLDDWEIEQGKRLWSVGIRNKTGDETDLIFADCFAAAFRQYPEIECLCTDARFAEFMQTLLESTGFNVLHESTRSNVMASDMAAVSFAEQYAKLVQEDEKKETEKKAKQFPNTSTKEEPKDHISCIAAAGRALQKAQEEVEEFESMCKAFGSEPSTGGQTNVNQIKEMFHKVKNNQQLRRIIELAGRYRMSAQSKQRQKVKHGYDDMIGIELAGDIGRLLPVELALLADEDLELDALRRLVEKQSMCRLYEGREPQAKGPVVICVDESGSMNGEPIAQAKAFCLAMYWIARHQKRQCILVSFHCGRDSYCFAPHSPATLIDWLEHFYGGGTDLHVPLVEVPKMWDDPYCKIEKGKTDLIVVTDACLSVDPVMKEFFLKWKEKEKVKVQTIVIGANGDSVKEISDQVHCVQQMVTVDSEAVQSAFSI